MLTHFNFKKCLTVHTDGTTVIANRGNWSCEVLNNKFDLYVNWVQEI